ncbi:hypothetical protein LB519_15620 [Mesorhizobium sp. AD1-1]|uniref:hypothetical protein n=1 Tax=unclassified Mesorhizobium TaxID=325217 RepID=UPI001CC93215|nr:MULTISPECIES: hypothetical protein [unclassified Mesorhizobium]MBZ9719272.1 hypothetical protein [Mesorhizobium sp. AD1-1]MCA0030459.1 hypothetical protein [Mesorhizobium sp. B263B2A]
MAAPLSRLKALLATTAMSVSSALPEEKHGSGRPSANENLAPSLFEGAVNRPLMKCPYKGGGFNELSEFTKDSSRKNTALIGDEPDEFLRRGHVDFLADVEARTIRHHDAMAVPEAR